MNEHEAARAIASLTRERPEWLPVLGAALRVAERCEAYGGEFAGSWVLDELRQETSRSIWLPNLRLLISYGFLEKAGESSRGGRRAYYRFTDRKTIERVLGQVSNTAPIEPASEQRSTAQAGRFKFVGAGDSRNPGSETGRRAGDISYEPRSWR